VVLVGDEKLKETFPHAFLNSGRQLFLAPQSALTTFVLLVGARQKEGLGVQAFLQEVALAALIDPLEQPPDVFIRAHDNLPILLGR